MRAHTHTHAFPFSNVNVAVFISHFGMYLNVHYVTVHLLQETCNLYCFGFVKGSQPFKTCCHTRPFLVTWSSPVYIWGNFIEIDNLQKMLGGNYFFIRWGDTSITEICADLQNPMVECKLKILGLYNFILSQSHICGVSDHILSHWL